MKKSKSWGVLISPIGVLIGLVLLWTYLIKPQINQFVHQKVSELNQSQTKLKIEFDQFDVSILRLQIYLKNLEVQINEVPGLEKPILVKRIVAQLDPFRLLVGQVGLTQIQINQLSIHYENLKPSTTEWKQIPTAMAFKYLPQIPVDLIVFQNSEFHYTDAPLQLELQTQISFLSLRNLKTAVTLDTKRLFVSVFKDKTSEARAEIATTARLNYNSSGSNLVIQNLELKNINSTAQFKAQIEDFENLPTKQKGEIEVKTLLQLDDVRTMLLAFQPSKTRWPTLTGSVQMAGRLKLQGLKNIDGELNLESRNVGVDHFKFGQARVSTQIKKNQITINQIQVEHPAGVAALKQIEIQQNEPYGFKTQLHLEQFDLQKLFISIGLKEIPAGLLGKGNATCSGYFKPELKVTCEAETDLKDIWVKAHQQDSRHILKLKQGQLIGRLDLNSEALEYKTQIKIGQSEGVSQGKVSFSDGFKIQFETPRLDFNDVESLADLNFRGELKIKGQTSGGSNWGTINSVIAVTNGEIDSFRIDQLSAQLIYEKSELKLNEIEGRLKQSTYTGQLGINFSQSSIAAQFSVSDLHGEDLLFALNKRFNLPFELSGRGQADINLFGPLDFWKLKYSLKSQLRQGVLAGEGYDILNLDLNSTGEQIQLNQVYIKKTRGRLNLSGSIETSASPTFNLTAKASPLYLEEIDQLIKLTPALTGQAWIDGKILGPIQSPDLQFNFSAKQINLDSKDYPTSQGQISIDTQNLKLSGQLFGRQIQTDLVWPWSESNPFIAKFQIRDLDPLMFLPLISIPQPTTEYYGRLNADIDLKGPRRHIKFSEGTIRLNDFMLQRGPLYLKLRKPSQMIFKTGLRQMDPVDFRGDQQYLNIGLESANSEEVRFKIASDLQLKIIQFLVPFSQNLSGRIKAETLLKVREESFDLFGDGELNDGLLTFKGFPTPIDNINAPIQFSKSKIILSDIFAQLGNSEILGQGQVDIKGSKNIVVNLQANTDNLELTFPDKVFTAGRADLVFKGNWLPYTLKIDYRVARGLFEKNFDESDPKAKVSLKSSPFLPQKQTEQKAASLLLDADIDLTQGVIVKNKIIEGEAFGRLKIGGSPEQPEILGRIDIRPGSKLFFKDKPFEIQTASVQFNDPQNMNPDIFMNASARVSEYDINLLVQGPAKNLAIQPSSQPPLSKEDIFSLLALGMTSTKLDQNVSSEAQQQQTGLEVLAAIGNQSQINKQIQQKFGLTVQLAPTIDSTKNIAVPKVVVSRNFTKNINASYSRPITGDNPVQEWKLQYLFNPNSSMILNYQSTESNQQEQSISNTNKNDAGILGLDFEYKREWK